MASLAGADAYFEPTLRQEQWAGNSEDKKKRALNDAGLMVSRLSFSSRPPASNLDYAIYEQAFCFLEGSAQDQERQQSIMSGLKSFSVGRQSESYQDVDKMENVVNGMILCPGALGWLAPYLSQKIKGVRKGRLMCGC